MTIYNLYLCPRENISQDQLILMVCRAKVTPKLNRYSVLIIWGVLRRKGGQINSGVYANAGGLRIRPRDVQSHTTGFGCSTRTTH